MARATSRSKAKRTPAAVCAIEEHSQLALSVRDSKAFVDALLNPQPVNARLHDTVQRYRERAAVCVLSRSSS